jgi:hypothetical protein
MTVPLPVPLSAARSPLPVERLSVLLTPPSVPLCHQPPSRARPHAGPWAPAGIPARCHLRRGVGAPGGVDDGAARDTRSSRDSPTSTRQLQGSPTRSAHGRGAPPPRHGVGEIPPSAAPCVRPSMYRSVDKNMSTRRPTDETVSSRAGGGDPRAPHLTERGAAPLARPRPPRSRRSGRTGAELRGGRARCPHHTRRRRRSCPRPSSPAHRR